MKEADLRKYHRRTGITVAVFVFFQALTGLLLSVEGIAPNFPLGSIAHLHHGGGLGGNIYRILLALGLLFMACSGTWIFSKMRSRDFSVSKKKPQQPTISG